MKTSTQKNASASQRQLKNSPSGNELTNQEIDILLDTIEEELTYRQEIEGKGQILAIYRKLIRQRYYPEVKK